MPISPVMDKNIDDLIRENEKLKENLIKVKFHNYQLKAEVDKFLSFKPVRLRRIFKEEGISIRNIFKIIYLLVAMVIPERIRKHIRPIIHIFKKKFNSIFSETHKYNEDSWNSSSPLLSVVIPCFNYGNYINDSLASVLAQTFEDYEIIIVEGGSTDDGFTRSILKKINNPKTRVLYRNEPHLAGDNRNYGIEHAKGKYICCFDADDKLDPTYFEKALYFLENEKYDIVSPSIVEFDEGSTEYTLPRRTNLDEIISFNTISTVGIFRKSLYIKNGGYYDYGKGEKHVPEDWDFWVKQVASGARVLNLLEPLMMYRVHGKSLSRNKNNPALINQRDQILTRNSSVINDNNKKISAKNNYINYLATNLSENLINSYKKFQSKNKEFLVIIPFTMLGGADNVTLSLVALLHSLGMEVSIITTVPFDRELFVDTSDSYLKYTNRIFHIPRIIEKEDSYPFFIESYIRLRNIKNIINIGSTLFYNMLPDIKTKIPDLKIIDIQFNTDVHFQSNKKHRNLIDITIAENTDIYNQIIEEGEESKKKVELINNGIDTDLFSPKTRQSYKRGSEYTDSDFIVTYLGRLSQEKGPDLFVDIANEVLKFDPLIKFVLAGPGSMFDECYMKIKRLHLEASIKMPGKVNGVEYLSYTDLIVVPSRLDGRPLSIMESLSMGIPVIASNVGGIPEMVIDKKTGLLCEKQNVSEFADAILKLKNNRDMLNNMSKNAREFAVKNFSRKIAEEKYKKIFLN